MIDESEYYQRIADNIKVSYRKPKAPAPKTRAAVDRANALPAVPLLAKHLLLLAGHEGTRPWALDIMERMRAAIDRADPMVSAFVDVLAAPLHLDLGAVQAALNRMSLTVDELPEAARPDLKTILLFAKAGAGLLPDDAAIVAALSEAEGHLGRDARYFDSDAGRAEALRVLLGIGLAKSPPRSDEVSGRLNAMVEHWCGLEDVSALDQCLVYDMLVRDFEWWAANKAETQQAFKAAADAAMRVSAVARRFGWLFVLGRYLQSDLAFLSKFDPTPHLRLANTWVELANTAMFTGGVRQAPHYHGEGVRQFVLSIENRREDYPDEEALRERLLVAINNLGWSLLINERFAEAKPHLEFAFETRGGDTEPPSPGDPRAGEHATVMQNLSECCLALGEFEAALEHATSARTIRAGLDDPLRSAESAKCEGFALYFGGATEEGLDILARYSASIRRLLDYDEFPRGNLISGSYIDGRFVHVDELVDVSAKLLEAKMLHDAFIGSRTIGVARFSNDG